MRRCYYFNPENDLALANGSPNFLPPKKILQFASDLSLLPLWYAPNGSIILTRTNIDKDWNKEILEKLGIDNLWFSFEQYSDICSADDQLYPWGWNHTLLQKWKKFSPACSVDLQRIKEFSSRSYTIELLAFLRDANLLDSSVFIPEKLSSYSEVKNFCSVHPEFLLKSPWSGSGKGLFWYNGLWRSKLQEWSLNLLSSQGYLIGERIYNKQHDFAMEFLSSQGEINFVGFSLFKTDSFGHYKYNILTEDAEIERFLSSKLSLPETLSQTKEAIISFLRNNVAKFYDGYLGIDMMMFGENECNCTLHPCVEINLRLNMGIVSRVVYDRFVNSQNKGLYNVRTFSSPKELSEFDAHMQSKFPLCIADNKVCDGYLALTPIGQDSRSLAYLLCTESDISCLY